MTIWAHFAIHSFTMYVEKFYVNAAHDFFLLNILLVRYIYVDL